MNKMYLVSLGCPKNLVDSELMLGVLEADGFVVVDDPQKADLLLVNTCGFIRPAVEEAVDEILRLAQYKENNDSLRLVVTGCMVQRYGEALQRELPEVDLFVGIDDAYRIDRLLNNSTSAGKVILTKPSSFSTTCQQPRRLSTPFFRAYLKITEGCDNRCTYCMIPSIRGNLRSRSIGDLVTEAKMLAASGVQELTLIAQDLTAYGDDLNRATTLTALLEELLDQTAISWFRLLYLYPVTTSDSLLELIARDPRIMPYLDIPFQHVSDTVLRRMNRHYSREDLDDQVRRIRHYLPGCAIRSTFLVGFPGETEDDFQQLIDCLQRWQLDHVGVFPYEDEEGARASAFSDKVPAEVKQQRYDKVMELQSRISKKKMQQYIGREEDVLVAGLSQESDLLLEGRTRFQAPDIDGCVYINDGTANPGDIVRVRITEAHIYDLVGKIIS